MRLHICLWMVAACGMLGWAAGSAQANNIVTPPWVISPSSPPWDGGQTSFLEYEFNINLTNPTAYQRTWTGTDQPQLQLGGPRGWQVETIPGFDGTPTQTWHYGRQDNPSDHEPEASGTITITVPDYPPPQPFKDIQIQITSDKGQPAVPTANGVGATPGAVIGSPLSNGWYTYVYTWHLVPNPPFETIVIPVIESTNFEEIVIHTICNPEPTSLMLLGLAAPILLARRRRAAA